MVGSLEAGENPTQAFASAAEASRSLVRREFREVARRLTLGMHIRRALRRIIEGYDSEGVRLFTQTLIAKWEVGGDLIPIVESVARVIRERLKVSLHLKSQLAGARISSVMIALIPYALVPFFLWQRPESLERLLDHPLGPTLLTLAVLLQIIGFLWLRRLLRIEM
jgi:Flp pilus assembly protein TadB